jgi:ABC-type molybdate transport system substrate-binding protein
MKTSTIILLIMAVGLILGGVAISGCTQQAAASPAEIKIGVVASLTGPASATGKDMWQSAQIAADEINANGGVYVQELGQKIPVRVIAGDDESTFVKVHDNDFIQTKKRLYMTATPRLYSEEARLKAAEKDAELCSMDDVNMYGEEIYRIGFGEAVERNLLSDYKVLICYF